jgi:hypothetical protein
MKREIFQTLSMAPVGKVTRIVRPVDEYIPSAGDVALFECCEGSATLTLEGNGAETCVLQPGQRFFGVLGAVYGPGDLAGYVPERADSPMHVLHPSGIVGSAADHCLAAGSELTLPSVRLLSLVMGEDGAVLNTRVKPTLKAALPKALQGRILFVGGTDAQAGTRELAQSLAQVLENRGYTVARVRINGFGPDARWKMESATSASICLSFEDLGLPGTYLLSPSELRQALSELLARAEQDRPDWVIVELEQNLLQRESDLLLNDPQWKVQIAGVALAASSPIAALGGMHILQHSGLKTLVVGGAMLHQVHMREEFQVFSDVALATPSMLRKSLLPLLSLQIRNDWDAYVLAAS